jgi:hypothetical protein
LSKSNDCQTKKKKRLLSIKEVLEEYGVTDWFWRTQIWDRKLPCIKVGRKQLIDTLDIEQFLQQHKTEVMA